MNGSRPAILALSLVGAFASGAGAQDITSGLIGHWKLTETSGTTANDSSSGGRNGTFTNGVSLAASVATPFSDANSAKFDGFNDYVAVSGESSYDLTGAMTVSAWIRVDVFDADFQGIVCKGNSAWRLARDGTTSQIQFACSGLSTIKVVSTSSIGTGQWRHIVGVFTGSQLRIYVDGTLENSVSVTGSISTNNYAVNIGRNEEVSGREFDGAIYDVRVYNRALSTTDIEYLFTQGLPRLHWKLDETSGTTADDAANLNNGTVTGTASWIAARRNNGFDFNGATRIETSSLLDNPSSFTLACWARIDASDTSGAEGISLGDYVVLRLHQSSTGGPVAIFYRGSSAWVTLSVATNYVGTGWRHFAATFDDGANMLRLYVDGVQVASTSTTYSVAWSGLGTVTRIGTHGNTNNSLDLDGAMDDVRVYNRALSAAEIVELYGLLGHWKLNETSGTSVSDSSGIGNNGTVIGTATWTTGARDNGFSANYTNGDDYINVANSASLEDVQEESYTVAAWFKPLSTPPGSGSNNNTNYGILLKQGWHTGIYYTNYNTFAFEHFLTGDVSVWAGSSTSYAVGTFHHVAATVNRSTGAVKIYVNGELQGSNSFAANTAAREYGTMPWRLGIGSPGASEWRWPAHGVIDDARIYNRVLDAEEVRALYGLLAHWKFNEGSGTSIADSSGNGHHAAFATGAPSWVSSGPYGGALAFSGANDAVTNNDFPPPSEGTVTWWFRSNGPSGSTQRMFGLGDNWEVRQESDGLLNFDLCMSTSSGGFTTTNALATADRWYHVAAVYDSDDESYAVYVDGELQKSGISGNALSPQTAAKLSFGTRTGSTQRFAGRLDDFRVYDRKLTHAEIRELYGLVGWYKFDETSGTVAADSSGLGNNGTYAGSPTLNVASNGNAAMGTAVDFNGSNYVQIPGVFNKPSSVSVTAWARLDASDTNSAEIVSLGDHVTLRLKNNSAELYYYNGSTWVGTAVNRVIAQTGWHHYAAVFDETGTYNLYIDGNVAGSGVLSGGIPYNGLGANTRIGSHGNGQTTYDFDGRIDDVRVFKRPVTADEVYQLYRGTRIDGIKILQWVETR